MKCLPTQIRLAASARMITWGFPSRGSVSSVFPLFTIGATFRCSQMKENAYFRMRPQRAPQSAAHREEEDLRNISTTAVMDFDSVGLFAVKTLFHYSNLFLYRFSFRDYERARSRPALSVRLYVPLAVKRQSSKWCPSDPQDAREQLPAKRDGRWVAGSLARRDAVLPSRKA